MKESSKSKPVSKALLLQRKEQAGVMAQSKTVAVTLKIPGELTEWLDRYRYQSYPDRIEKQALVTEALKLLYLARGEPGTPVFSVEDAVIGQSIKPRSVKTRKS